MTYHSEKAISAAQLSRILGSTPTIFDAGCYVFNATAYVFTCQRSIDIVLPNMIVGLTGASGMDEIGSDCIFSPLVPRGIDLHALTTRAA